MYCLYMFCRGILVIGPKRAVEDCGARYRSYHCSRRLDPFYQTSGPYRFWFFQNRPSNGNISSRAYLNAFFQATRHEERTEREEIIPQRD